MKGIWLTVGILSILSSAAFGGILDGSADIVLGQTGSTGNTYGLSSRELNYPVHTAVDSTGRLYIGDSSNYRILWWDSSSALASGAPADGVLGQDTLDDDTSHQVSTNTVDSFFGLCVDAHDNLWVADGGNNRVLKFARPQVNNENAVLVLGQEDFLNGSMNITNTSTPGRNTMNAPENVFVDAEDRVWVADYGNNRVLMFDAPLANGADADLVLGQVLFSDSGSGSAASALSGPYDVFVDPGRNVWVVDNGNNRVLRYRDPRTNGAAADLVLGQLDFGLSDGSTSAKGMRSPESITGDDQGSLWVADSSNYRVLRFTDPSENGVAADLVLGQQDFDSGTANRGAGTPVVSATGDGFDYMEGVYLDRCSNLWITDSANNRVLRFNASPFIAAAVDPGSSREIALRLKDLTVNVSVPDGAFAAPVTIRVSTAAFPSGEAGTMEPTALCAQITDDQGLQPLKPVVIRFSYQASDVGDRDASLLTVARYDEDQSAWTVLASTADAAHRTITAATDHFSRFGVFFQAVTPPPPPPPPPPPAAAGRPRVFPNPYDPRQGNLTFAGLVPGSDVKIFTLSAELVRTISPVSASGTASWNGKNGDGASIAGGIYFALVRGSDGRKQLKIAVVR